MHHTQNLWMSISLQSVGVCYLVNMLSCGGTKSNALYMYMHITLLVQCFSRLIEGECYRRALCKLEEHCKLEQQSTVLNYLNYCDHCFHAFSVVN